MKHFVNRRRAAQPMLACALVGLCFSAQSWALVVVDDSSSTSAPSPDPGFANVGNVGVYIGGGWVLTAAHVGVGTITFPTLPSGQNAFTPISAGCRLTNPSSFGGVALTANTDLLMYRINEPSGLSGLTLSSSTPSTGDSVTLIADGLAKGAATTIGALNGFSGSGSGMRWGTNNVHGYTVGSGTTPYVIADSGSGAVISFATIFDDVGGTEAQALSGDSGGAVFRNNSGSWELAGIINAVDGPDSASVSSTALYGNVTYIADLAQYSSQISVCQATPVPEAGGFVYACVVAVLSFFVLKVRKRQS